MTPHANRASWLAHLPVHRKIRLAFALLLALIIANGLAFFYVLSEQRQARNWTIHTYQVLDGLQGLLVEVVNQELSLRNVESVDWVQKSELFRNAQAAFVARLEQVRELIRDNPAQQARLDRLELVMGRWQRDFAEPLIALDTSGDQRLQLEALAAKDKLHIEDFKATLAKLQQAERELLVQRSATLERLVAMARWLTLSLMVLGLVLVVVSMRRLQHLVIDPLIDLTELMTRLSSGDHDIAVPDTSRRDEIGALARALQRFKLMVIDIEQRNWVKTHASDIAAALQKTTQRSDFGNVLTGALAPLLGAGVSALYLFDEDSKELLLQGHFGYQQAKHGQSRYRLGEGLTGQCARDRKPIVIENVPPDYVRIHSATGEATPTAVVLLPVLNGERLMGVLEFGSFGRFNERQQALLDQLLPTVALSLESLQKAQRTVELLHESQALTEELQASTEELRVQQEELRTTNESLQSKSQQLQQQSARLMASEEELRIQSDELKVSNEELRQSGSVLNEQKKALEALQLDTQQKADELARASQYKSEFLANMSHELRTPLNSLLILSRGLADNDLGHLDADEVESATVIHESGSNLLRLINDILDLSKVEAGKMELVLEDLSLASFASSLQRNFRHVARERGLEFVVEVDEQLPATIRTDGGKLEQIANNLLSNAFKFTRAGSVRVQMGPSTARNGAAADVAIRVTDTGIGIPADKFAKVFNAFEQVDGSTSRQFGGTGLGLSIARGMAQMLSGDIRLESTPGVGTTFTLLIPQQPHEQRSAPPTATPVLMTNTSAAIELPATMPPAPPAPPRTAPAFTLEDDRQILRAGETVILIVEDDPVFARILIDLVRKKGYRTLFAGDGEAGLALAEQYQPTGILLDVMLPGMDGFSVIQKLKAGRLTRHIPVHFISATEDHSRGLDLGAVGFLTKPVTREGLSSAFDRLLHFAADRIRQVLVVDDDAASRLAVRKLIGNPHIEITEAAGGADALALLKTKDFDCVILDLGMADINGFEFLERASALPAVPPVVVYSGRDLSTEENLKLRQYTDSIVIKGARSPERLLDEVSLFLHSIREATTAPLREIDTSLSGRVVLVVDDDMRNIFALSKALRAKGLNVVMAQDGMKALKQLEDNRNIELVLMDIMMPGMDGYQTMGEIRKNPLTRALPMIALTAKAMRGDREKCLEAGANDYLSKPIDLDKLFSMIRVWLPAG